MKVQTFSRLCTQLLLMIRACAAASVVHVPEFAELLNFIIIKFIDIIYRHNKII